MVEASVGVDSFAPEKRVIIFDMDGTLTGTLSGKICANSPVDQFILPGVSTMLQNLKVHGRKLLAIASNQGGLSCGFMFESTAWEILIEANRKLGGVIDNIKMCGYHPDGKYKDRFPDRRKPAPTMLLEILEDFGVQIAGGMFVGDGFSDQLAAKAIGMDFVWAHEFFQWPEHVVEETQFGFQIKNSVLEELRLVIRGEFGKL